MENKSFDINLNSIAQSMAVPDVSIIEFTVNLIIALFLAFIIKIFYENFAKSLSNRKIFSNILIYIALTTTVIITIVKSSLALSLGLVGALSIVRFRILSFNVDTDLILSPFLKCNKFFDSFSLNTFTTFL